MLKLLHKKILLSIALAAIIYLAFIIYADYQKIIQSFSRFNWWLMPALLALSLGNYFTRFLKWQYYLKLIKVSLKILDSLAIFLSGLVMSVTPGKMGELLKSYLVKQVNSTSISKTAPIVFAERITDFLALTLLAVLGAYYFNYGKVIAIIILGIIIIGIIILTNRKIFEIIIHLASKINFLKKHVQKIQNIYDSSSTLLSIFPLISMTILSAFSWGLEGLGYYLVISNFNSGFNLLWSLFSYSFATIVGAISMLPGGLGVTEGSLTLMSVQQGLSQNDATASTFIIRVVTLWFAVLIGAIGLMIYQRKFGKEISFEND
ncbi:MAG: hypothetical protein B6D44_07965 [Ignavibacteriales bacterium UTCHB2]|jgi:uncharacterized protein (TIRG00374 family)|nr:MAG: hypothetical protein BWY38_02661 [Ignavibacteria bacterium ADurb.Bin266]OQY73165.1 MAG: hypothetical protein B6D44_07965 [Ignavibacteriales bacterium UTCHB2]HQI41500.1 lysylphosphatidylglycerol synthase transmembrane domain-containing protein [Ignavibacteriaceae bacterium]HQJ46279.1 lysylphosphatidylglycerol synthase transmembrane domain-containing protein [Ignavibacteriaceae bacterium]